MESEILIPQKPLFYCCYIDDIYNRRKKFKHDESFEKLNNYHLKKDKVNYLSNSNKIFGLKFTS